MSAAWLVTGGTRGIGRAIVTAALQAGERVACCARRPGAPIEGAHFIEADLSQEADCERAVEEAVRLLGGLQVLVNNAGIARDALLLSTSLEEWNATLALNLRAPFLMTRRALEEFLPQRRGRIVNLSSIAANGSFGQAAYAASKSALLSLTRSVAKEYGPRGVRCNAVVPGYVETEMTGRFEPLSRRSREELSPQRRFGTAQEIAEAVLFLASDESSFVNGDALYVAGAVRDVPPLRR